MAARVGVGVRKNPRVRVRVRVRKGADRWRHTEQRALRWQPAARAYRHARGAG